MQELMTAGAQAEEKIRRSKLASEAAGQLVRERAGAFLTAVCEVADELMATLRQEADEITDNAIANPLDAVEAVRRWNHLITLTDYLLAVKEGRDPKSPNPHGGDNQRVMAAIAELRRAVRLTFGRATVDDKVASGHIFNVDFNQYVKPSEIEPDEPGVYPVPNRYVAPVQVHT